MNIALFLPNWLGDLVMATPAIRAISRHFGRNARLVGIIRPYLADVLQGTGWLDEQWLFDPRAKAPALRCGTLVRRLRRDRIDLAVLLTNSLRSAAVAWLGGARERIGYVCRGRGPLLSGRLYPRREVDLPMVDTYLALAEAVGCPPQSRQLELATTAQDERSADAVFANLGLQNNSPPILLNSSGAYGSAKLWPAEYFGELARRIVDVLDRDVLVLCGPKEREIARQLVRLADRPGVVSMADQPLDLGTSKACIRRSRLMVSTDSGPRHAAAALGLPVITLYGPMLPVWGENPTQQAVNLMLDLDCIGCHKRVCPLGHHRCMRQLTIDMVFAEVAKLIEQREPLVAA